MVRVPSVLRTSGQKTTSTPTINPARAQEKMALFHSANPNAKKPSVRYQFGSSFPERDPNLKSAQQPVTSKKCSMATGPQSNVWVIRKVGSVASRKAASTATLRPPIHPAKRKKIKMVAPP